MILTYCNVSFPCFLHSWAQDPGPGLGPKAAVMVPAWARPAAGPGPRFQAPKCENHMKIIWEKCENNVISEFHIIFTFYTYYFHIFVTFLGSGPRSKPPKSYFCHVPGHMFFILFSCFWICLAWAPVHTAIFEMHDELAPCLMLPEKLGSLDPSLMLSAKCRSRWSSELV